LHSSAISSADDLVGAKVIRRRTLFKYLDNGPEPDSNQEFPEDIFYIERKSAETNITVTWQLASKIDLEGLLLPRRVITQDHCLWRYRGAECGYSGPPVANEFDQPVSGLSGAAQAYNEALQALQAANSRLASAQAELNDAEAAKDIVCDTGILQRSEPKFNLRRSNGPYTFGIQNGAQYFAAYDDDEVILSDKFIASFGQQEEGDAVFGDSQNTGRGPANNGTGSLWAVNRWVGVVSGTAPSGDPPPVVAQLADENEYDPPRTFAMLDLGGNVLIARNGTIRSAAQTSNVSANGTPSITTAGEVKFARGERRENNISPVVDLRIWEVSSSQCEAATERFEAAEEELEAAEAAQAAAQAAFNAALAALPPGDPINSADRCGKRLSSCRLRFGTSTLPFGAFPGANLFR
jgi:hypothetical protein